MGFLGLPDAFIAATVVYVIARIIRAIGKDNTDNALPVGILEFVSACVMAYSGIVFLLDLI